VRIDRTKGEQLMGLKTSVQRERDGGKRGKEVRRATPRIIGLGGERLRGSGTSSKWGAPMI